MDADETGVPRGIDWYLAELPKHFDDMNWLSNCAIKLSTLLYNLGDEVAQARFAEYSIAVNYMDAQPTETAKKMSNAEAEKRAVADTKNEYERRKLYYEAVIETINSIKKRLDNQGQLMKMERR